MAKKYKYRHQETYKDVKIDIRADTIAELMDKVSAKKTKIDREFIAPDTRFKPFVEKYMETYKSTSVSNSWYKNVETIVNNKLIPSIGNKPVGKIKPMDVQLFLNSLQGFSESYIKKIYDITCQVFRHAYINGMTDSDLTLNLKRPKGLKGKTGRSLTENEREVLLDVLNGYITEDFAKSRKLSDNPIPHRGNLFCKIMLYCGLRPSEVAALLQKDVNLTDGYIDVNKTRKKDGSIGDPKSDAGFRKVPIPDHLINELSKTKRNPFDLVCPQSSGAMHTETSMKTMWKNIKRLMNIGMGAQIKNNQLIPPLPLADDFTMYNLRHTYCTDLERKGVPINIARQLMGHSTIILTSKIYTHASTESFDIAKTLINAD